jgi:hypothetical protein
MTLSITKNCLFLALAISPVASAQIVTESSETTTYPTGWVRSNDTTAKTEDVTGIMERGLKVELIFGNEIIHHKVAESDAMIITLQ